MTLLCHAQISLIQCKEATVPLSWTGTILEAVAGVLLLGGFRKQREHRV